MIQAIERFMKQAIVDRNPAVSSASLISSHVSVLATLLIVLLHPLTKLVSVALEICCVFSYPLENFQHFEFPSQSLFLSCLSICTHTHYMHTHPLHAHTPTTCTHTHYTHTHPLHAHTPTTRTHARARCTWTHTHDLHTAAVLEGEW